MAHGAGPIGQVDAVQPMAFDQQQVAFYDDGHVAGMGHNAQRIGSARDAVFVARGQGKAHAGHVKTVKHRRKPVWKDVKLELWRCDKVDLRAFGVGHRGIFLGGIGLS
jgi:hypothetical protein